MGFKVEGLGSRVQGSGFRVQGAGSRVPGLGRTHEERDEEGQRADLEAEKGVCPHRGHSGSVYHPDDLVDRPRAMGV